MTTMTIINEIKKLRSERAAIDKKIAELEEKLLISIEQETTAEPQTTTVEPQTTTAEPQRQQQQAQSAIIVDRDYLNNVYKLADRLEDDLALGNTKLSSDIKNVLEDFDADDVEESINNLYGVVLKYAYMLDTQLSSDEWKLVESFLSDIGYNKLNIKTGEAIAPYKSYFARPIEAKGGVAGTIKAIQKMPFVGKFYDGYENIELKLCGKCTFYK